MICFYYNIGCSECKVIFKWRKNNNNKKKPLQVNFVMYDSMGNANIDLQMI